MNKNYASMTKAELIKALQALESHSSDPSPAPPAVPYDHLLHDLQVHQEELEAQNQALRDTQTLLEESRSRYAELYDLAPLGYVTLDGKGLIQEINLTGAILMGTERSRLIGLPFTRFVATANRDLFREHVQRCQAGSDRAVIELHLLRPDASVFPVELHSVPIARSPGPAAGCLTALIDITERKRLEEARQESQALFRAIFEEAGTGMALLDTAGHIRQTNRALQEMLGYSAEELGARTLVEVTHPDDVAADRDNYAHLIAGDRGSYQIEKRYRRRDGQILWGQLTVSLVRNRQGQPRYVIGLLENITESKRAEAEVRRLNRNLEQHATELAIANQELESFSYSISHDLRAPLTSIDSFTRAILEDYASLLPPEGQDYVSLIHENATAMSRLIEALLGFSRVSRQPLNKQPVITADLVSQVLANLRNALPDRSIEIVIGDLPVCQGDPVLLNQVWINLLSNALKFTSKCDNPRVEIGSLLAENEAVYFVKDNGVGFDMEQAGRLFGVFQRLHGEEDYPGTGVGLAIVDRIVRRHGGRVWAEAEVGKGATFSFTLPS